MHAAACVCFVTVPKRLFKFYLQCYRLQIEELCDTLNSAWTELNDRANERSHKLELSLKAQQFFFEANEVESWLHEKSDILASTDYGRDRDAATKLLTKHKVRQKLTFPVPPLLQLHFF